MLLSVSAFCTEAQCKEETISRRLKVARIDPEKEEGRARLFRLGDLLKCAYLLDDDGKLDPAGLDPFKRKAHFQAQLEEVRYQEECGELVPKIQMQEEMSRAAKVFAQAMDTLPDILERDCGLTPAQIASVEKRLDAVREEVYQALTPDDQPREQPSASASA
jgi:hypothetical protein